MKAKRYNCRNQKYYPFSYFFTKNNGEKIVHDDEEGIINEVEFEESNLPQDTNSENCKTKNNKNEPQFFIDGQKKYTFSSEDQLDVLPDEKTNSNSDEDAKHQEDKN